MSLTDKSLAVLTPMHGGVATNNHVTSLLKLAGELFSEGIPFSRVVVTEEAIVPKARNRLVDEFMKRLDSTHALLVDADIGFDPKNILEMLSLDRDIVGVPCSKKCIRWDRIQNVIRKNGRSYNSDELVRASGDFIFNVDTPSGLTLDEPFETKNLGTGLLMVRRGVFEKMQTTYPDRWYDASNDPDSLPGPVHEFFRVGINPDTKQYASDDYWFCADA